MRTAKLDGSATESVLSATYGAGRAEGVAAPGKGGGEASPVREVGRPYQGGPGWGVVDD